MKYQRKQNETKRIRKPYQNPSETLTLAISAKSESYPERFQWILENRFALEYTPDPERLELIPKHVVPFLKAGIPVRFHFAFKDYEIGRSNREAADSAVSAHISAIEAIHGLGEQVATIHISLDRNTPLDYCRVVDNLGTLAVRAKNLGITLCLENLRDGPTSDPEQLVSWACAADVMITLDIGHAASCALVQRGELSLLDFVEITADRLVEAHVYSSESDRHYPIQNIEQIQPAIDRLLTTECKWWTIELDDYEEALSTRSLLLDYIASAQS